MTQIRTKAWLYGVMLLAAGSAAAQEGPRRGPPQEALASCQGLSSGAACGFTLNGKNLTGTCRSGPDGSALACAPAGMGPGGDCGGGGGGPHGPPQEALTACQGQTEGATCSVTLGGNALTGTCRAGPKGEALACLPPHGPGGPGGHHGPPQEAITACASSTAGASCSVTFGDRTLTGTCVAGPRGEALACRPPRPD